MGDECAYCHGPLNKSETVFAGLGYLFCSKQCAVKHLAGNVDPELLAELAMPGCIEEVRADEIGVE